MGKRGALVIFMKVPNRTNAEKFKSEAALVGVPWVAPEVPGLRTFDGSHLNQESADRFAKEVFKELMKVPEVRRVLGEGDRDIKKAPSLEGRGLRDL